jgi:hypothetical protein
MKMARPLSLLPQLSWLLPKGMDAGFPPCAGENGL